MTAQLRVMKAADIPDAMRLKDAAGWNQTALDWERFLGACPEGCFVAESGGRVIGTATTIVFEGGLAWIGMVIVESEFRGRGVGTGLLNQAIAYLDSRGVPCMKLDATPQGRPLYAKLGFRPEYDIERWMLRRTCSDHTAVAVANCPTEASWVGFNSSTKLHELLQLDHKIFGADRSLLLRSVDAADPQFTLAVWKGKVVAGYAFGRRGSHADQLGPWMAADREAAEELLERFLDRSERELVFVDCVKLNPWAIKLVRARGFEFSRPLTRMFRGRNGSPGSPERLCAILGPEFG